MRQCESNPSMITEDAAVMAGVIAAGPPQRMLTEEETTRQNAVNSTHQMPNTSSMERVYRISSYGSHSKANPSGTSCCHTNPLLQRFHASSHDSPWHSKSSPGAFTNVSPAQGDPAIAGEKRCIRQTSAMAPDVQCQAVQPQYAAEIATLKKIVLVLFALMLILTTGVTWLLIKADSIGWLGYSLQRLSPQEPCAPNHHSHSLVHASTASGHGELMELSSMYRQQLHSRLGVEHLPLTGLVSGQHLRQLSHVIITGSNDVELNIKAISAARVPQWDSFWGTTVAILTPIGTLILDGTQLLVSKNVSHHLVQLLNVNSRRAGHGMRALHLADQHSNTSKQPQTLAMLHGVFIHPEGLDIEKGEQLIDPTVWNGEELKSKQEAEQHAHTLEALIRAIQQGDAGSEAVLRAAWSDWKRRYGKPSSSEDHDTYRFQTWLTNIRRLVASNLDPTLTYWGRVNAWFDVDVNTIKGPDLHTEIQQLFQELNASDEHDTYLIAGHKRGRTERQLLGQQPQQQPKQPRKSNATAPDPPPAVDWVAAGKVTPVKDQQRCGNCWAWAAVSSMESAYLIAHPNVNQSQLDLSEAEVTFCVLNATSYGSSRGCLGGTPAVAFKWMVVEGVTTENMYPFPMSALRLGANQECLQGELPQPLPLLRLAKPAAVFAKMSERALMQAVAKAPVVAYFQFVDDFWHYSSGVYNGACPSSNITVNHVMTIVGYNTSDRTWLAKNSWGADWGDGGYVRLPMSGDNIGKCGLQLFVLTIEPVFSIDTLDLATTASASSLTTSSAASSTRWGPGDAGFDHGSPRNQINQSSGNVINE